MRGGLLLMGEVLLGVGLRVGELGFCGCGGGEEEDRVLGF